MALGKNCTIS